MIAEVKLMLYENVDSSFKVVELKHSRNSQLVRTMDVADIDLSTKSIIALSGNMTKTPERAVAYSKYIYDWLDKCPDREKIKLYSIFYPRKQPLYSNMVADPTFDYKSLSKTIFKKVIIHNGQYLDANEISKNLSNIVFFGHSVGGMIMNELVLQLEEYLKKHHYEKSEINKIISNIVFISYSPFKIVDHPINAIYITPLYDTVGSAKLACEMFDKTKKVHSTFPGIKQLMPKAVKSYSHDNFLSNLSSVVRNEDLVYIFKNHTIVCMPNLLYYDGIKEDHNLAGVIDYKAHNTYKTMAGEKTTEFIKLAFNYCLQTQRENFNLEEFYQIAISHHNTKENIIT